MGVKAKQNRIPPRRLKGFRDLTAADVRARERMIQRIRAVYERYGYVPLETPALEYVDVLGKFLPDADRPDGGIFALRDDEEEWIALRYDLTAPLSRYVAMNPDLPKPFRRYQVGPVFRVEKPGPGRFREFHQFDFDTVGSASMLADAETCMVICDALENLGITPGEYRVAVSNRKILDGVLESVARCGPMSEHTPTQVLRAIDKRDRIGLNGVELLLGPGRRDESGDFTPGAGLEPRQIQIAMDFLMLQVQGRRGDVCEALARLVGGEGVGTEGVAELREIDGYLSDAGYDEQRVMFDPTIVRGLGYYTGPVFEATLTFDVADESGQTRPFGSVFGGGRYDHLVERFTGQKVPATGGSIGVDRMLSALRALGKLTDSRAGAAVLVTRLDPALTAHYLHLAAELRAAGIDTELYVGKQPIGKQFKYASDTGKTIALIMGSDELRAGQVSIKDLRLGDEISRSVGSDRKKWLEEQPAQFSVPRSEVVRAVREVLSRYEPSA